jgi:hypothetical protein
LKAPFRDNLILSTTIKFFPKTTPIITFLREDKRNMYLKVIGCKFEDKISLAQDIVQYRTVENMAMNLLVK